MLRKSLIFFIISLSFVVAAADKTAITTKTLSILDYQKKLVDMCNFGSHVTAELSLQCLSNNWSTIKDIQRYCEKFNCRKYDLTMLDYNDYNRNRTVTEMVDKIHKSLEKSAQESVVLQKSDFCNLANASLESKGWIGIMKKLGVNEMFELFYLYDERVSAINENQTIQNEYHKACK